MAAPAEPTAVGQTVAYTAHGNGYINLTSRCTLRCGFCPKFHKDWEVDGYDLRLRSAPTPEEVLAAVGDPGTYREVVFCGLGEPTLRLPLLLAVADRLKARGATIRVNTDGLASWREGRDVTPEIGARVDALSISLNAQHAELYDRHCRPPALGAYAAMLDFAGRARHHVAEVTLTAIHGLEGVDIDACRGIAERMGVNFRARYLDRVG